VGLANSAEQPLPVRTVAASIAEWVDRLGRVWVEGQVTQVNRRSGTAYLVLRDPVADMSLSVTCSRLVCDAVVPPLSEGDRVVVHGKPEFYAGRGTLTLKAVEIRPVGVGELLARLERLKGVLAAEGLFAADRKKPLPFLPRRVGLITGRASAAERDVLENARRRWPAVQVELREVAVQGVSAVEQVVGALRELDRLAEVDVIVIAAGGGSVEDLLAFSDETLCRAGRGLPHPRRQRDRPRAGQPAARPGRRRPVLDPHRRRQAGRARRRREAQRVRQARDRCRRVVRTTVERELARLEAVRSRPVLAAPATLVDGRRTEVGGLRDRARRCTAARLEAAAADLAHVRARVVALSPQATLDRGYAVVQDEDGAVVRDADAVEPGTDLQVRLARGTLLVTAD
jgi:exodeoxyribonuclease VII large subunit